MQIKRWLTAYDTWDKDLLQRWVGYTANPETLKQVVAVVLPFGVGWACLAFAHVIGPWFDALLGLSPHTPDSYGKIMWRRMWSSALCGPVITYALIRFAFNSYKNSNEANESTE